MNGFLSPGEDPDGLERVPEHRNGLGDWCPYSGLRSADGTCPQFCKEADDLAGFDAGREDCDDEEDDYDPPEEF